MRERFEIRPAGPSHAPLRAFATLGVVDLPGHGDLRRTCERIGREGERYVVSRLREGAEAQARGRAAMRRARAYARLASALGIAAPPLILGPHAGLLLKRDEMARPWVEGKDQVTEAELLSPDGARIAVADYVAFVRDRDLRGNAIVARGGQVIPTDNEKAFVSVRAEPVAAGGFVSVFVGAWAGTLRGRAVNGSGNGDTPLAAAASAEAQRAQASAAREAIRWWKARGRDEVASDITREALSDASRRVTLLARARGDLATAWRAWLAEAIPKPMPEPMPEKMEPTET